MRMTGSPLRRWSDVRRAHNDVFHLALQHAKEGVPEVDEDWMSEEDVRVLWPFDD